MFGKGKKRDDSGVYYIDGKPYETVTTASGVRYGHAVNTTGKHSVTVWERNGGSTTYSGATPAQISAIQKSARAVGLTTSDVD